MQAVIPSMAASSHWSQRKCTGQYDPFEYLKARYIKKKSMMQEKNMTLQFSLENSLKKTIQNSVYLRLKA